VVIASDGRALELLKKEFPTLDFFELPGYNVVYERKNMALNLFLQMPRIVNAVRREHKLLDKIIQEEGIDAVISDNRFGLFTFRVPTVFMTHQIEIPTPHPILGRMVNYLNRRFIERFDDIWVPDAETIPNLTGSMSHGTPLDFKVTYLGPISRMELSEEPIKYDLGVVLSGPEPQRTKLEHILLSQLAALDYKVILVRGIPGAYQRVKCSDNLEMVSFMTGKELNKTILQSDLIISRSGYTTIMDLAVLGKKALFIPTPGQLEQEELAKFFSENNTFHSVDQEEIDLSVDIPKAYDTTGLKPELEQNVRLHEHLDEWMLINELGTKGRVDQALIPSFTLKKKEKLK